MSALEFEEWMAYDSIDPIGYRRADILVGVLGAIMGNLWRNKESGTLTPEDILKTLPWWKGIGSTKEGEIPVHWTVIEFEKMMAQMEEEV